MKYPEDLTFKACELDNLKITENQVYKILKKEIWLASQRNLRATETCFHNYNGNIYNIICQLRKEGFDIYHNKEDNELTIIIRW